MAANLQEITARLGEVIGSSKVFGEPIQQGGVTVIPVFRVSGGGGAGGSDEGVKQGFGGGLRVTSRPVGVYVLREGRVSWKPSVDVNQAVLAGSAVVVAALALVRLLVRDVVRR